MRHGLTPLLILALILTASPVRSASAPDRDERTVLALNAAERERMLAGMRTYLASLQEIVSALAANKVETSAPAARRSGAAMLQDVSPVAGLGLPPAFLSMSFDTHDKFDRLADKAAQSASRTEILRDLDAILSNCNACHASFRLGRR